MIKGSPPQIFYIHDFWATSMHYRNTPHAHAQKQNFTV